LYRVNASIEVLRLISEVLWLGEASSC
jgi:hypothetical protein